MGYWAEGKDLRLLLSAPFWRYIMANPRSNVVSPRAVKAKTTKMNDRAPKEAARRGPQAMIYPKGHFGGPGNGLIR
tara:strand:+ start:374 stop:601 length:228 start_codon:yes stop_codon:yes gene_type:complete